MKRILPFIQSSWTEILGFVLLVVVYWWATQAAGPPHGLELNLLESAREALENNRFFYPTYNETLNVPISPLLMVFVSMVFKFVSTTIFTARAMVLVLSLLTLATFHTLASRTFHMGVGMLSTCFLIATWGFFSNSHIANGAMLYSMLVIIALILFFHWFDSAFRSRTYARSLYVHFILLGMTLGLCFCANGIPGLLYPLLVMVSAVCISNKAELFKDVHYAWLLLPLALMIALWSILGILSVGFAPYLLSLVRIKLGFQYLLEPILYLLPVLPFMVPAVLTKDIWNRGFITYQKSIMVLAAWMGCSLVFLLLFADYHETFSLLTVAPAIIWIGFYLSETFKNPLFPFSLQLVVDSLILGGLIASICCIILTFQVVPPNLFGAFIVLSFALPIISIVLLFLRDLTISRTLPFYIIPCNLLLCILAKFTLVPLFEYQPAQDLSRHLSQQTLENPNATILEWAGTRNAPSVIRFLTPLHNKVIAVNHQEQLESLIQTRSGPVYLLLPEKQFYSLPYTVREMGYMLGTSWQWKEPLSIGLLLSALRDEMLDFASLSEPVILFEVPAIPDA